MSWELSDSSHENQMAGFRQGEEKSFDAIFHALYPALCLYSFRITKSKEAARDIAEESFVKIWERREQFHRFASLRSYLYTTVRNASLDWLKNFAESAEPLTEEPEMPAGKNRLECLIEAEVFRQLMSSLDSLPRQRKKIIRMIFFEGRNTREVAEALGLSQSTVKTQKSKAMAYLRKRMLSIRLLF
jgi:RNA polymerase sigma-70 factor (ECF subfamily)